MTVSLEMDDEKAIELLRHLEISRQTFKNMKKDAEGSDDGHAAADFYSHQSTAEDLKEMVREEMEVEVKDAALRQP